MNTKDSKAGPPVKADDKNFVQSAGGYERDRELEMHQSKRIAWRVAGGSAFLALALGISLAVMSMKFEPVAFLVTVDKTTGESSVMKRLDKDTMTFEEVHDKFNLKRYIQSRESYNYAFLQRDYNLTMDMSCEPVAQDYAKQFDGDKGLDKVLGAGTEYRINVISVRPLPDQPGKAVVTFDKTVKVFATNETRAPQRYLATLAYEYKPNLRKSESVWIDNPTGFRVCSYRADPELASNK